MMGEKISDYIVMGLSALASLIAFWAFFYTNFIFEKPLPENTKELEAFKRTAGRMTMADNAYQLDKLIINLPSRTSRPRFLDTNIHLVPLGEDGIKNFEENKARIQDTVIDIVSRTPPEELGGISGKILLKSRLKTALNGFLGQRAVKDIYFTRFVIQ